MDHLLYLMANNYYLDSWYSGAVAGIANDAEGLNLDVFLELSTTVKETSLVEYLSQSEYVLAHLKQQQTSMQY